MTDPGSDPVQFPENHHLPASGGFVPVGFAPVRQHKAATAFAAIEPPQLLWPLAPRLPEFFDNLTDLLLFRGVPHVSITAAPAEFWSDVFVDERVSYRALRDSALVHVLVVLSIVGVTRLVVGIRPPKLHDAFPHTQITYYNVSEYLPELHTAPAAPRPERKAARTNAPETPADPVLAKQEIISVPPNADNLHQTIVTASPLKIDHDVPLPNIVIAQPPKAADVMQISNASAPKLETPPDIVAPKLGMVMAAPEVLNGAVPEAAHVMQISNASAPKSLTPPEVAAPKLAIGMKMPEVATGAAPKAAPTPMQIANGRVRRNASAGAAVAAPSMKPTVAAPALGSIANALPKPAPAPVAQNGGAGKSSQSPQQILALNARPANAAGPLNIPNGSRLGTFAAGPEGRAGATGAPASAPASSDTSANGDGLPAGIRVSGGGDIAPHSGVVASGAPEPHVTAGGESLRNRMNAMLGAANVPPPRVETKPPDNDPTARAVFGEKRYYKLTVNMPNLTSGSGSWVIRFAELHPTPETAKIPLASPMPTRKSDPGYPPELMKDKVEGTVVLYAVIRADGEITDVKVLSSVNPRLDESAMAALHRWQFQPGSKDGHAVDVEAVVQVPFRVKRLTF